MNPIIEIKNIGKKYKITHNRGGYVHLRDVILNISKRPFNYFKGKVKSAIGIDQKEDFWALKNLNFNINKGEVIGIIGRNGAGKSTLLKILSQITSPTEGEIIMRGSVGSLLEVGTGFHPELTGRENIFLNGAILGMSKKEIISKFDKIIEFAGIQKFMDTPVKYYSSGMYVRLAFSVAAHMEPDILIVDEVLAVGDTEFQEKCLGKMEQITQSAGRTILFVSHNMGAVRRLCQKTILLEDGKIKMIGDTDNVINEYLRPSSGISTHRIWDGTRKAPGNDIVKLREVFVHDADNNKIKNTNEFDITKKIAVTMKYEVLQNDHVFIGAADVFNERGEHVFSSHDVVSPTRNDPKSIGMYYSTMYIPENFLAEGTMTVAVAALHQAPIKVHFYESNCVSFTVIDRINGSSARGEYSGTFPGIVRPKLEWKEGKINK